MTRTVTATEAKNRLGSVLRSLQANGEPVIVESRGQPTAVISSYRDYEELQCLREERRRQAAIAELRELQKRISERNLDLSDEEADRIADEIVRDAIQAMVDKGQIRFVDK